VYLYYGNPAATVTSSGNAPSTSSTISSPTPPRLRATSNWAARKLRWYRASLGRLSSPHTLSVLPVNSRGYTYWGYYGLQGGCADGLAFSNDLVTWTKYTGIPCLPTPAGPRSFRWARTFYMLYEKDYCTAAPPNHSGQQHRWHSIHRREDHCAAKLPQQPQESKRQSVL